MGYLFFLLLMTISFFGLFGRGYVSNQISSRFSIDATIFAFVWFVFFSATYLIRFVYPFMMNEGRSRWWYFTIPLSAEKLLLSKIFASLAIATPLFLIAASQWWILPFSTNPEFLTVLSVLTLLFLTFQFCLIGSLKPDFNLAYLPDKASTTLTGIFSLIVTMAYAVFGGWSMKYMFMGEISQTIIISAALVSGTIITITLWILVTKTVARYTLDS